MSTNIETDFLSLPTVNPAEFRFWQDIHLNDVRILVERSGWANYLCYGIVDDALQNNIIMLNDKGDEHEKFDEIRKDPRYAKLKMAVKRIIGDKRAFGWSYGAIVEKGSNTIIKSYTSSDIDDGADVTFDINDNGEIINAELKLRAQDKAIESTFNTTAKLEKGFLLIQEHGEMYVGWSYLAPIFDSLFAEWAMHDGLSLFIIRVAGGIHIMELPPEVFNDDPKSLEMRKSIKAEMNRMGKNTKLIVPAEIAGVKTNYKLYTGEGSQPWAEMQEVLLSPIAGYSGIPIEALKGMPTAFKSSENHNKKHMRQLEQIQKEAILLHEWGVKEIWGVEADFKLEEFKELTEAEAIDIKTKKLAGLAQITPHMKVLGLTPKKLFEFMDLDLEPDMAVIAEQKVIAEKMQSNLDKVKESVDKSELKEGEGDADPEQN